MARTNSRFFVFTMNNPVDKMLPKQWVDHGECVAAFWSLEKAPSTGTLHLQGVLKTKENPRSKAGYSRKWVSDNVYRHMDVRVMAGTLEQAKTYCSKEETHMEGPWEFGNWSTREQALVVGREVKEQTWKMVQRAIIAGDDNVALWDKFFGFMTSHHKAMDVFRLTMTAKQRNWHTKCLVITGPPGTGKSATALAICEAHGGGFWPKKPKFGGTLWMDGYNPYKDEVIVFDEFDGSVMPFEEFNGICDRYPHFFETKGSMVPCLAKLAIFISNKLPRAWWSEEAVNNERWKAFQRRTSGELGTIKHMVEPFVHQDAGGPSFESLLPGLIAGTHDWNGLVLDPLISALPNGKTEQSASAPSQEFEGQTDDDFDDEEAALHEYENHLSLVDEYNAEHEGGSSYGSRVRKLIDLTDAADECKPTPCPCLSCDLAKTLNF